MPSLLPIVNKARKPKFELHLNIYDLNNVPLVSGTSQIKWYLPHSMHSEHRGRTNKFPIDSINHRVVYNYSKVVPLRISIDRNNHLSECPIEFEVAQEFPGTTGVKDEKIILGVVRLNLSEYVEESENFPRRSLGSRSGKGSVDKKEIPGHRRLSSVSSRDQRTSGGQGSPTSNESFETSIPEEDAAEEGITRRYLMQESKINSTLKLGILMVQVDGDRNYVAPPLKTAPMFGGIAGIMAGETVEPVDDATGPAGVSSMTNQNKSRDASELHDMYRRSLAASWACQPGELPADECIEDIFSGGDGWKVSGSVQRKTSHRSPQGGQDIEVASSSSSYDEDMGNNTLRPSDARRIRSRLNHSRQHSGSSEKSFVTVRGRNKQQPSSEQLNVHVFGGGAGSARRSNSQYRHYGRDDPFETTTAVNVSGRAGGARNRSESHTSLASTIGSTGSGSSSRDGAGYLGRRHFNEVNEFDARDDLVSWALPGTTVS
jgi:hypothetical protein